MALLKVITVVGAVPQFIKAAAVSSAVADFEAAGAQLPADRPADLYGSGHSAEEIVTALVDTRAGALSQRLKT